jgi:phosphatidylserine/phosphatidylglycerophosphate/cardiolipin synthase-like enzyme
MSQTIRIVILVVILLLAGYYLWTGSDPFGLFSPSEEQSPVAPPALVGSGGDWWQVYFTDPQNVNNPDDLRGSIPEKLIEHINNAQRSIHIAAFEFDLEPVADALITAQERGVEVQWVTDDEYGIEADEDEGHDLFPRLEKAGIEVKDDDRSALMHNKFWVFDGQTVWTGSTNITANGNFRNNNNVLVIDSREVAGMYEREFDEMWAGEFGPTSPSTLGNQSANIDGTPVQILFAAEDEVISNLIPLIKSAQDNIRFMAFSFTHDELGEAVRDRAKAGVDVKGIFEKRGSAIEYCELCALLYCVGAHVRQDGNPYTFHHKVFVIDDEIVVTGSLNFSGNADDSNDENVVIVANRDIAAQYLQEFERRWAEATPPDPEDLSCEWELGE